MKVVKFADSGKEGAIFPQLQSRTYKTKGLLTRSLNALDTAAVELGQASGETVLIKKRKAGFFWTSRHQFIIGENS